MKLMRTQVFPEGCEPNDILSTHTRASKLSHLYGTLWIWSSLLLYNPPKTSTALDGLREWDLIVLHELGLQSPCRQFLKGVKEEPATAVLGAAFQDLTGDPFQCSGYVLYSRSSNQQLYLNRSWLVERPRNLKC